MPVKGNTWRVSADLVAVQFRQLDREFHNQLKGRKDLTIDCGSSARIDSAGIAWLLDCVKQSKSQNVHLHIAGLSTQGYALMEAHGVLSIIKPYLERE